MKTDPFFDTCRFLFGGGWPSYLFWLFLLGAVAVAVHMFVIDSRQRTVKDLWMCAARIIVGGMWWEQTFLKLPPYYTELPGTQDSGLRHWMLEMVDNASFSTQSQFVKEIVLPHLSVFAPFVYAVEVFIATSLILGLFTRVGATLGALVAVIMWLGLYRAAYAWPWTYLFLIVIQVSFVIFDAGRSLGLDAKFAMVTSRDWGPVYE
ncbi:MAG: DoxX family protein [Syntrophobacteraceae bacterium]